MRSTFFALGLLALVASAQAATYRTETCDASQLSDRLASLGSARLVSVVPALSHKRTWCPPPAVDSEIGCHPVVPEGPILCVDPSAPPPPPACMEFQILDSVMLVIEE